jgi:hypothetical protein
MRHDDPAAPPLQVQRLVRDPLHPFAQQGYSLLVNTLMQRLDADYKPGANGGVPHGFSADVSQKLVMQLCSLGIIPYFQGLLQRLSQCKLTPPPDVDNKAASTTASRQTSRAQGTAASAAADTCAHQAATSPAFDGAVGINLHLNLLGFGSVHATSRKFSSALASTPSSTASEESGSLRAELCVLDAAWYLHQLGFIFDVMLPALYSDKLDPHCRQEYLHALTQLLSTPAILTNLIHAALSPEMLAAAAQEQAAGRAANTAMGPSASYLMNLVQHGIFERFAFTSECCMHDQPKEKVLWEGLRKKMVCYLNSKQNRLHLEDLVLCSPLKGALMQAVARSSMSSALDLTEPKLLQMLCGPDSVMCSLRWVALHGFMWSSMYAHVGQGGRPCSMWRGCPLQACVSAPTGLEFSFSCRGGSLAGCWPAGQLGGGVRASSPGLACQQQATGCGDEGDQGPAGPLQARPPSGEGNIACFLAL